MIAWLTAALGVLGVLLLAALGDLISEEVRGWLDLAPRAILRLAATQLNPGQRRSIYRDEWLPELTYILRGAETRPITRLVTGARYAIGLLIAARRIDRVLTRTAPGDTVASSERKIPTGVLRTDGKTYLINSSGYSIRINTLDLAIANGSTFSLVNLDEKLQRQVIREFNSAYLRSLRSLRK